MIDKAKNIITGHVNELLDKNKELSEERMDICKQCPLFLLKKSLSWFGPVCGTKVYLNTQTGETSEIYKPGFRTGCGCRLEAKTRDKASKCPLSKW